MIHFGEYATLSPLPASIRPRPVNPPTFLPHWSPKEFLVRRPFCVMVENGGALVEASRMPRIAELEQVVVKVMTELVAQRTQKCPKRCDFFLAVRIHNRMSIVVGS